MTADPDRLDDLPHLVDHGFVRLKIDTASGVISLLQIRKVAIICAVDPLDRLVARLFKDAPSHRKTVASSVLRLRTHLVLGFFTVEALDDLPRFILIFRRRQDRQRHIRTRGHAISANRRIPDVSSASADHTMVEAIVIHAGEIDAIHRTLTGIEHRADVDALHSFFRQIIFQR